MDREVSSSISSKSDDVFDPVSSNYNDKQRAILVEWLNGILPDLSLPINSSDEELRAILADGSVLCRILNKLKPGPVPECDLPVSPQSRLENVERFLSAMDEMGLPRFQATDLAKGSMKLVLDCLLTLQTHFMLNIGRYNGSDINFRRRSLGGSSGSSTPRDEAFSLMASPPFGEDHRRSGSLRALRSPKTTAHAGHTFHEVFQLKQGSYADLPAARIWEMMKSNSLDNAPTQSLLSIVNGILDESVEMKNGEIPHRVACLLRKVVQEIERRICTQAEHLRTQNNLFKAREEKYQSRIRVLEALATGTSEETQIVMNQLQQIKSEKNKIEEKKKVEDQLIREKDELNREIENLKQELERATKSTKEEPVRMKATKDTDEVIREISNLRQELQDKVELTQEVANLRQEVKEKDGLNQELANLKKELETAKRRSSEEESTKVEATKDKDQVSQENANLRLEVKEKDVLKQEITILKKELEIAGRSSEQESSKIEHMKEKEKDELNQEIVKLRLELKEKEVLKQEIANLKKELEIAMRSSEHESSKMEHMKEREKGELNQEIANLRLEMKERDMLKQEVANLKKELEIAMTSNEQESSKMKLIKEKERDELNQELAKLRLERKEKAVLKQEIENLKKELEIARKSSEQESSQIKLTKVKETEELNQEIAQLRQEVKEKDELNKEIATLREEVKEKDELNQKIESLRSEVKEKDELNQAIAKLRQELETAKRSHEEEYAKAVVAQRELEHRLKKTSNLLTESRNKVKELEVLSESKSEHWNKKQKIYHIFSEFQLGALRELRFASQSIQQEVVGTQKSYSEEFIDLGSRIKILGEAAKNYHPLLAENRKMHNELQELKGNIRVYCRVRPFLPGQKGKQSIVEYIGDDGEIVVTNPSKPGKEGRRSFKFDKVYGPTSKQAEVYTDTQPLIQSVLDGYNVCIFAYGQTGSGKTYTMTGPDGASEEEWGVNYRALNDLFRISQTRESIFKYEVSVQMVEIYNEQVRDLLSSDGGKKLGILTASQPSGLAVPDACIQPVNSPPDVLKLMDIGLQNRAKSSTAMNERSSRSHSIVSIHTRGVDLKSGSSLRGSLHLVDLAGSERVDRSEVTGDRLKEAQHINKSLSALGDVIFALAQKSAHVPYRNSKLTQVLQSSLGGRAKTLMFVQLNPDATSYSETVSTLKFAERVSGIELGAAKSSKDGKDVRDLMEQVTSLKDTIAKKDEEIEALKNKATS